MVSSPWTGCNSNDLLEIAAFQNSRSSFQSFNPYEHGKCLATLNEVEIIMIACTSTCKMSLDIFLLVRQLEFKQAKPKLLLQRCQFSCTVFLQL